MLDIIKRYLKPEARIVTGAELREGPAIMEGVAAASEAPLRTPGRGEQCVAYGYTAYTLVKSRAGAAPRAVHKRVVQGAFTLRLADGSVVSAVPSRSDAALTPDEHREFANTEGVVVDEQPVRVGRKVRVEGMLSSKAGAWTLTYRLLENIGVGDEQAEQIAAGAVKARPPMKKAPRRSGKRTGAKPSDSG